MVIEEFNTSRNGRPTKRRKQGGTTFPSKKLEERRGNPKQKICRRRERENERKKK